MPVIAYGIMIILNAYDNQIYAYGKGPSAITVTAPSGGVTTATPITISGSVIDNSAGSQQEAVASSFPNGVPAVSDVSQTAWMEYVYMQQPKQKTQQAFSLASTFMTLTVITDRLVPPQVTTGVSSASPGHLTFRGIILSSLSFQVQNHTTVLLLKHHSSQEILQQQQRCGQFQRNHRLRCTLLE
jgi:hypothetical protein